jgi:putative flippase GtrA
MKIKKRFFVFLFAGILGAIVEILSFNLFFLKLDFFPSKIIALIMALSLNFSINRTVTFLASSGKMHKQAIRYITVYSIAIIINISSSYIANLILGKGFYRSNLAVAIGILVAIPITYFGSLFWVFKKERINI